MKPMASLHPTCRSQLLDKRNAKHVLGLTNNSAWTAVIFFNYRERQKSRYANGRNNLKQRALNRAVVHQTMDRGIASADQNLTNLSSVSANSIPSLRFHRPISNRLQALTDSLTTWPITAPLKRDDRLQLLPQIHAERDAAIGGLLLDGVEHDGMLGGADA